MRTELIKKIYIVIFILIAHPTIFAFDKKPAIELLVWVAQANPIDDAKLSISQGDCRLKTITGGGTYPGVDKSVVDIYRTLYGETAIEGTRDNFGFDQEAHLLMQFQREAVQYAKIYNQTIVDAIEKDKCTKKDIEYVPPVYEADEDVF